MAHTFTSVHLHLIFSTKNRLPLLSLEIRERLFPYMGGIIRDLKAVPLIINGMEDHVHLLSSLPTTVALSDFMREIKSVSSGWARNNFAETEDFGWQIGYAAFSVSKSNMEVVRTYIAKQQEHRARVSFQEEYLAFLDRHGISYDARFVFEQELAG